MKVVIVGGVAGGATAAARIRRLNETARILVFERSGHVSYANCGLPYYIGGVIEQESALSLQTPESFWKRFRVEMKTRHEVTAIHPDQKTVSVRRLEDGMEFEESYDKLLLSPGARPVRPPVPGLDSRRLFTLRTVEDTTRIHRFIQEKKPRSAVLAGGGFISLELAENLKHLGMDVTIVQMDDQLLLPFDKEMASFLHTRIRQAGIRLLLGHAVTGFSDTETGIEVQIQDSPSIEADMAVLAIGVAPDTDLARKAGLKLGAKGYLLKQDYQNIIPAVRAVYSGQTVFGEKIVSRIPELLNKKKDFHCPDYGISERELDIIRLIAEGLSNKEIASRLYLSEGTVRNYLSTILDKLDLRDRTQVAIFYYQNIDP